MNWIFLEYSIAVGAPHWTDDELLIVRW